MALTVTGRWQHPTNKHFYCHAQDPNDLDSVYMIGADGANWYLWKFTWPDTLTQLVDLGTWLTGKTFRNGIIANGDFAYGLGYLDTNRYFCFGAATYIAATDDSRLYVINLEDLTVDYYAPAFGLAPAFQDYVFNGHIRLGYDAFGTYAYSILAGGGNNGNTFRKYVKNGGAGAKHDQTWVGSGILIEPDDQHFISYKGDPNFYKVSTQTGGYTTLGSGYMPTIAYLNSLGWGITFTAIYYGSPYQPMHSVTWDDNWRYLVVVANGGGGIYYAIGIRKNIATGQFACSLISNLASAAGGGACGAIDIWKEGSIEKVYFTFDGEEHRVFGSTWPFTDTDSIMLDDSSTDCPHLWTATGGYIYVYHYLGANYGSCITKLLDSDMVPASATPSISAPGLMLKWKDKRVFFSGVTNYERFLWWAQPYEPQALDIGWDGYNTTVFDDEDITALIVLEDTLYAGSKKGWMRLRGKTPDHWALDLTLATYGPLNDKAVSVTPFGAIYPRSSGLYLFNGYTSRLFFEKGKGLMENVNWASLDKIFSLWDGRFYRLFYPKGSATSNDRELIVDMIAGAESARGTEGDRAASAGWADIPTGTIYLGDESGNVLTEGGGSTSRDLEITTKEYPAQGLIMAGSFSKLHYDIDCAGASVYVTPIYDGVAKSAILIPTNSTRTRSHILLPKGNAFRVGIKITVSTAAAVKVYEPWVLE